MDLMVELFTNTERTRIITYFLDHPGLKLPQHQIIRKLGIAKGTAIKHLKALTKNGLLTVDKIGVTNLYALQKNSLTKHLRMLRTISNLAPLQHQELHLYGSASRGEDDEHSHIDLIHIGEKKMQYYDRLLRDTEKKIGRSISLSTFTAEEWLQMKRKDPAFYDRVERDKIAL